MLGAAPYSVTKHAAVGFAEWLAATYAHRGLAVHCICPQGVRTQMLAGSGRAGDIVLAAAAIEPEQVAEAPGGRDGRWASSSSCPIQKSAITTCIAPPIPTGGCAACRGCSSESRMRTSDGRGSLKAWQLNSYGEPEDVLELADVPRPVPGPGQLLVRVLAAAANFPDVLMCRGTYQVRPPLPFTPGVELCGEVVEVGPARRGFDVGDRVIGGAVLPSGAFAEYAVMDAARAFPAPESFDDAEAAPFLITYQTGWFGLHRRARLAAGETLLVHAAAGGVGSGAVQLGKAAGARVIGVVGGQEKARMAERLGADVVVDRPCGGLRRGRQGSDQGQGGRCHLRPGGRRVISPVGQVHRVRGPDRGRRLRQR